VSQWRCKDCGAIRAVPDRFRVSSDGMLLKVFGRPCKRCGSSSEPEASSDPWLDIDEEAFEPVALDQGVDHG